jgi:hypothetical protein
MGPQLSGKFLEVLVVRDEMHESIYVFFKSP